MDIKFYDFEFNLLAVLPRASGTGNGYAFLNYKVEFRGHGSFEITYISKKIDEIVTTHRDDLFVVLDDFQGFLTGYRMQGDKHKLYGKHLNGLLNRRLIPLQANDVDGNGNIIQKDFEEYARTVVSEYYDFLKLGATAGIGAEVEHETTNYTPGDKFLNTLFEKADAGYHITADFVNKKLIFNILKKRKTPLMLSESNLNAYDFDIAYDNKDYANYAWYSEVQPDKVEIKETVDKETGEKKTEEITEKQDNIVKPIAGDKNGIYRIDVWLSAETASEAVAELKAKKPMFNVKASTRRIKWNTDYILGDIVRMQKDGVTVEKSITEVTVSVEASRIETPTLTDYEEVTNNGRRNRNNLF